MWPMFRQCQHGSQPFVAEEPGYQPSRQKALGLKGVICSYAETEAGQIDIEIAASHGIPERFIPIVAGVRFQRERLIDSIPHRTLKVESE